MGLLIWKMTCIQLFYFLSNSLQAFFFNDFSFHRYFIEKKFGFKLDLISGFVRDGRPVKNINRFSKPVKNINRLDKPVKNINRFSKPVKNINRLNKPVNIFNRLVSRLHFINRSTIPNKNWYKVQLESKHRKSNNMFIIMAKILKILKFRLNKQVLRKL